MAQNKQQGLNNIASSIVDDNICPELAKGATQLVFGSGNPDADLVFVGEAPGKNEDLQGKPFVGASGKLLDEMLDSISLSREDVYITNIVKYRPPNNRDPLPAEKQAFLPYLQAQIEVIHPKIVIPLGRHSMNCFLPDLQIGKVHGQAHRIFWPITADSGEEKGINITVLPLYHPAMALYNRSMRSVLFDDFKHILKVLLEV